MGLELLRMGVAERLRAVIENSGLQQKEIALRSGVPQSSLSRLMTADDPDPRLSTLLPLARTLRVSIDSLVSEDMPIPETPLTPYDTNPRYKRLVAELEQLPSRERDTALTLFEWALRCRDAAAAAGTRESTRLAEAVLRLPEADQAKFFQDLADRDAFEVLKLRRGEYRGK